MARDTRTRMLDATARLLQQRGYHGTSLSDILAASEAPRGSLYFHFPGGKDQLAIEATRAAVALATAALQETLASAADPAAGVRAYVEAAAGLMRASDYTFGCPVAPVILDQAGGVAELADLCRQAFETWTGMLRQGFVDAGASSSRAATLALLVVAAIEGGLLLARAYRDCEPLLRIAGALEKVVQAGISQAD